MLISDKHIWIVVLAAGEGKRVLDLTHDRWEHRAPKQYSCIDGNRTLLGVTLERARRLSPPERIVPVVAAQHRRWWTFGLAGIPRENVIVQPENRGTAAGILLPLLWITKHDPKARLVILPSDHGVSSEDTLHAAIADATSCAACSDAGLVLLGVQPEGPETDYGWIVPKAGGDGRLHPVACFREKPDAATAAALLEQGGLLNSFILIADGGFLLDLFETALPQLWRSFRPLLDGEPNGRWIEQDLASLYLSVPTFDFSKDLLERAAELLWVHSVPACGWLDLGTPERLTGHLRTNVQKPCDAFEPMINRRPLRTPRANPRACAATEATGGVDPYAAARS